MEKALQLPELLYPIFCFCEEQTLSNAARVCKQWSVPASDSLWKQLDNVGLVNLVNQLAPLSRYNAESMRLGFIDHPRHDTWVQFLQQAKRVQRLSYCANIPMVSTLGTDVFSVIATTRPTLEIMPNLKALLWMADGFTSLFPAQIFMRSPALSHLDISVGHSMDQRLFASFLTQIPHACQHLTNLSLGFAVPMHVIKLEVLATLVQLPGLRELELPGFCFTKDVLACVSGFPLLERFATRPIASEEPHGDIQDVVDLAAALPLRTDAFPSLHSLRFDATLATSHALLADRSLPRILRSLFVATLPSMIEQPDGVKEFLAFLAEEFPMIDDLGLGLLSSPPPVAPQSLPMTFASLRPMLGLKNVERFYCSFNLAIPLTEDDIREMGAAWGGKLRVLWFWSPLYMTAGHSPHTTLTLSSLGVFAESFPNLTDLGIYFDARVTPALSDLPDNNDLFDGDDDYEDEMDVIAALEASSLNHTATTTAITPTRRRRTARTPSTPQFAHLAELGIGISPISGAHTLSTALWLAEYIPHEFNLMTDTGWSADYARLDDDAKKALAELEDLWMEVQSAHRQLWPVCRARREREERRRGEVRALRKRLRALEAAVEEMTRGAEVDHPNPNGQSNGDAVRGPRR